jgi:hypothetical protein
MDVPTLVFDFLAKNIFIESSAWEGMLSWYKMFVHLNNWSLN